jgi:hypothetical protein
MGSKEISETGREILLPNINIWKLNIPTLLDPSAVANLDYGTWRLTLSKDPTELLCSFSHLKTETDSISVTLRLLVI